MRDITNEFYNYIPELKECCKRRYDCHLIDEESGLYVIWGIGIRPCIENLLKDFEKNEIILKKIFVFFEKMAKDEEVIKELLMYAILETLGDNREILKNAIPFMGNKTKCLVKQLETFYCRDYNMDLFN